MKKIPHLEKKIPKLGGKIFLMDVLIADCDFELVGYIKSGWFFVI